MSECKDYAYSLINNLSLLSGYILKPTVNEINQICFHLETMKEEGSIRYNDNDMRNLINGTLTLNKNPNYNVLKKIISNLSVKKSGKK